MLRKRKLKINENKIDVHKGQEKPLKAKTTMDLFLNLKKTSPSFTEYELIKELNVLIMAVSSNIVLVIN